MQMSNPVTDTIIAEIDSDEEIADVDWTGAIVIESPWADEVPVPSPPPVAEVPTPLPVDEEPVQKRQRQWPTPPYDKHRKNPSKVSWGDLPPDEFKVPGWGGYWCEEDGWFIPTHSACNVAEVLDRRSYSYHYFQVQFPGGIPGDGRKTLHYNVDVYGRNWARRLAWRHVGTNRYAYDQKPCNDQARGDRKYYYEQALMARFGQ